MFTQSYLSTTNVWQNLLQRDFHCQASQAQDPEEYYKTLHAEHGELMAYTLAKNHLACLTAMPPSEEIRNKAHDLSFQLDRSPRLALEKMPEVKQLCSIEEDAHAEMVDTFNYWFDFLLIEEKLYAAFLNEAEIDKNIRLKENIQKLKESMSDGAILHYMMECLLMMNTKYLLNLILDKQSGLVNMRWDADPILGSSLHIAIYHENFNLMQQLIAKYADVNAVKDITIRAKSHRGEGCLSPLLFLLIIAPHRTDMIELLLKSGACLNDLDKHCFYKGIPITILSCIEELKAKTDNNENIKKTLDLLSKWRETKTGPIDQAPFLQQNTVHGYRL